MGTKRSALSLLSVEFFFLGEVYLLNCFLHMYDFIIGEEEEVKVDADEIQIHSYSSFRSAYV